MTTQTVEMAMRDTGLPVAFELSEMHLTRMDLKNSLDSLTLWSKQHVSSKPDDPEISVIQGSLLRDGITQLVGCFDSKNAFPLVVETVFPSAEGIAEYFRWLRSLRNAYTAHRHGAARQCIVGVIVHPVTGAYMGHGRMFAIYAGPQQEGHEPLLRLIAQAIRYVDARISDLEGQFDTKAKAIPAADLLKLPPAAVQGQDPKDMNKSRGDVRSRISREHDAKTDQTASLSPPPPRRSE